MIQVSRGPYSNQSNIILTKRDRANDEQDGTEEDACWPYAVGEPGERTLEAVEAREDRAGDALQHSSLMSGWCGCNVCVYRQLWFSECKSGGNIHAQLIDTAKTCRARSLMS